MSSRRDPKQKKDSLSKYYSQGDKKTLVLDFSRIPNKDFETILSDLIKVAKTDLESLVISLDLYADTHPEEYPELISQMNGQIPNSNRQSFCLNDSSPQPTKKARDDPVLVRNSCFKANPKAIKSILLALKHCFKKTTTLKSIRFRSMIFQTAELDILIKYIKECQSIKSIAFENIPLYDKGFSLIYTCAKREGLETFECSKCGISDESIVDIKEILNYHLSAQVRANYDSTLHGETPEFQKNCIQELILKGNYLSTQALMEFGEGIASMPIALVDISDNKQIDVKTATNIRKNAPHCDLVFDSNEKSSPQKTAKSPKRAPSAHRVERIPPSRQYQDDYQVHERREYPMEEVREYPMQDRREYPMQDRREYQDNVDDEQYFS